VQRPIATLLDHLDHCLREQGMEPDWQPGAPDLTIFAAESRTGLMWPEDLREIYRRHDGENGGSMLGGLSLLSLAQVHAAWSLNATSAHMERYEIDYDASVPSIPAGHVRTYHDHNRWIPIAHDRGGTYLAVDLDPDTYGRVGQLITLGLSEHRHVVVSHSLEDFLRWTVAMLQQRQLRVKDERVCLVSGEHFFEALESLPLPLTGTPAPINGPLLGALRPAPASDPSSWPLLEVRLAIHRVVEPPNFSAETLVERANQILEPARVRFELVRSAPLDLPSQFMPRQMDAAGTRLPEAPGYLERSVNVFVVEQLGTGATPVYRNVHAFFVDKAHANDVLQFAAYLCRAMGLSGLSDRDANREFLLHNLRTGGRLRREDIAQLRQQVLAFLAEP
jgi:cell wall assembly regulator SMI1